MPARERVQTSLFPFMSVLACTIGVLVIVLAIMSLSAVGARGSVAATESALAAERVALVEEQRREWELAARALDQAEEAWADVEEALRARGMESEGTEFEITRRVEEARRIEATLAAIDEALKEIARATEERGEIEARLDVLESRRETLPILIDPTGLSKSWNPFFIECDDGGVTAYRARDDLRYFVPREEVAMIGDLARYLRRVRAEPGALLVLLVRSEGIAVAEQTKALARTAGIRTASLPLPGSGEIDWSLLRRAEGGV